MTAASGDEFAAPARFQVVRRIGAGGMGVVYEVVDHERHLRVALKHLAAPGPATLYLFKREFHALAGITHPNLVALYELISDGQQWFFTMELIDEGVDFMTHIRGEWAGARGSAHSFPDDPVPTAPGRPRARGSLDAIEPPPAEPAVGVDLAGLRAAFVQLATGVIALHRAGKLHRDLKPSNAMVRKDGRVVLVDFGLVVDIGAYADPSAARGPRRSPLVPAATDAQVAGSIPYMAPEQAAGKPLTEASDWYAVGVMLFEALTGRLPIEGSPLVMWHSKQFTDAPAPSTLAPDAPPDLDALCVELLRRDPAERPTGAEILARLAGAPPSTATAATATAAAPLDAPFVGRAGHLAQLRRAFDATAGGRAAVCRVVGSSGAGKTALVHRFVTEIAERGEVTVLAGRCYEQESVPYKTVDNVVDALVSHLVRLAGDAQPLVPAHLAALCRVFPAFERVAAWSDARDDAQEVHDPRELRKLAFAALRQLLAAVSARRRLVVYIDDVQWGDVDGATLLAGLLEPRDGLAMLLVLAYRNEDEATNPCLAALAGRAASQVDQTVVVDPLTAGETERLALELLGRGAALGPGAEGAAARAAWVVRESEGNALFVHELVRHLDAGLPAASTEGTSLDDVLWRRVCRLPDDARRLLEVIAIAGQPIRLRAAQDAAGLPALPPEVMTGLRSGQLIRGTGPGLDDDVQAFHDRVRESVVEHLDAAARTAHHGRLAATLEAAGAAPETIAAHCHGAGDLGKAADYYVAAADLAVHALAFERAEGFYRQAAELAQTDTARAAVWEKLIHYYTNMARFADAYAVGRDAARRFGVALPAKFVPPLFIGELVRVALRMRGRAPASLLELPTASDPRIETAVRLICAVAKAAYQLRPELCVAIATRVVYLCLRHGNTRDCAIGYMAFGTIFHGGVLGRHQVGHAFGRLALALVDKYDRTAQLAEVAFVVGYFGTSWLSPASHAEALWRTAYDAGQRTGDLFHMGCACAATVMSLMMRGAPLAAVRDESERHVAFLEHRGLREPLAVLMTVRRARALLGGQVTGETPCADAVLDPAGFEQRLAGFGSKHFAHYHYVLEIQVHYLHGELAAAAAAARTSAAYLKESPGMLHSAEHAFWAALVAAAQAGGARGWLTRAKLRRRAWRAQRKLARWAGDCPDNFLAKERVVAGELARLRGDRDAAIACYDAAVAAAARAGHLHIEGLAHELAARLLLATGSSDAALRVLDARRCYERWGATALLAALEARVAASA